MANILQNISQNRTNKRITITDIRLAANLAWLHMYPNSTNRISVGSGSNWLDIYCIRGQSGGKASCMWGRTCYGFSQGYSISSNFSWSVVRWGTNVSPSSIHHSLKITEGEEKIILDNSLYTAGSQTTCLRHFNFHLARPKANYYSGSDAMFFHSVVIFTPKPGLFNETEPS